MRYARQIELLGSDVQQRLHESRALVIGSGGLGSPALTALAVSGIGTIGVVDSDRVDITNLNRQTVHGEADIDDLKVVSAERRLKQLNSELTVKTYAERLTADSARQLFPEYDIIIDCVDNYETRRSVSTVAVECGKTVIEAGIEGFDAFVQIVRPNETACFNCLHSGETEIERQVLGAATGIVGSMQALECIKVLSGLYQGEYSYVAINLINYEIDTIFLKNSNQCDCSMSRS